MCETRDPWRKEMWEKREDFFRNAFAQVRWCRADVMRSMASSIKRNEIIGWSNSPSASRKKAKAPVALAAACLTMSFSSMPMPGRAISKQGGSQRVKRLSIVPEDVFRRLVGWESEV